MEETKMAGTNRKESDGQLPEDNTGLFGNS